MTTKGNTLDFSTVDHRQNRLRPVVYTKDVPATNSISTTQPTYMNPAMLFRIRARSFNNGNQYINQLLYSIIDGDKIRQ